MESISPDLHWTVFDLPEMCAIGRDIAEGKNEERLRFVTSLEELSEADIFIASGSLHYFDEPLSDLLTRLPKRPAHVIINRTPLTDSKPTAVVQDAGTYLVACKLYNRQDVISPLERLGYQVVDSWTIPEMSVRIPCHPELSVPAYSGYYLRLGQPASGS